MEKNICRAAYGPGPDDKRCRDCIHYLTIRYDKNYHKCSLRTITRGKATDHGALWPTCARFEEGQADKLYGPKHFVIRRRSEPAY